MKKTTKKILLLTSIPPCNNYSGGIVLEQLCRFISPELITCIVLPHRSFKPQISKDLQNIQMKFIKKPIEIWPKLPLQLDKPISLIGEYINSTIGQKNIIRKIIKIAQEIKPDVIWCILEGQVMIRLALPVKEALNIPLISQVWDPPYWWLRDSRIPKIYSKKTIDQFEKSVRRSSVCATASLEMAKTYQEEYKTKTIPFLPSLDANLAITPAKKSHNKNELIIGMAGQIYAKEEWNSLIHTLESSDWKIDNRSVRIIFFGRKSTLTEKNEHIVHIGWLPQKDVIAELSKCDILYCPYWFDPKFETESSLSFPSKLTTYLASGRPILFHGPKYASPAIFLEKNECGLCCYSLEPAEISANITLLISDQNLYKNITKNGYIAFNKYLTLNTLKENFLKFINIEE